MDGRVTTQRMPNGDPVFTVVITEDEAEEFVGILQDYGYDNEYNSSYAAAFALLDKLGDALVASQPQ